MDSVRKFKVQLYLSVLFLIGFLIIAFSISGSGYFIGFDRAIDSLITSHQGSFFLIFFTVITYLASTSVVVFLSVLLLFYLFYKNRHRDAILSVFILGGGAILEFLTKYAFHRARPVGFLVAVSGYSFPSGHALKSVLFFSLLIYLFKGEIKSRALKLVFVFISVVLVLLVGFSRIYLHAHWTGDVLGGWFFGLFWFFFSLAVYKKFSDGF